MDEQSQEVEVSKALGVCRLGEPPDQLSQRHLHACKRPPRATRRRSFASIGVGERRLVVAFDQ